MEKCSWKTAIDLRFFCLCAPMKLTFCRCGNGSTANGFANGHRYRVPYSIDGSALFAHRATFDIIELEPGFNASHLKKTLNIHFRQSVYRHAVCMRVFVFSVSAQVFRLVRSMQLCSRPLCRRMRYTFPWKVNIAQRRKNLFADSFQLEIDRNCRLSPAP